VAKCFDLVVQHQAAMHSHSSESAVIVSVVASMLAVFRVELKCISLCVKLQNYVKSSGIIAPYHASHYCSAWFVCRELDQRRYPLSHTPCITHASGGVNF
jgi:hypothetical protein